MFDLVTLLGIIGCILIEGFFSGSEIAFVSADKLQLRHQAAKGSKGAKLALAMLKKPERLLTTTLLGTNVAVVGSTTLATALAIDLLGQSYAWIAILVIAPLIWIFGEVIPKSVYQQNANVFLPKVIYVLRFVNVVCFPLIYILSSFSTMLGKWFGASKERRFTLREEMETILKNTGRRREPHTLHSNVIESDIQSHEKEMIENMMKFTHTKASEVMVPWVEVQPVSADGTTKDVIDIFKETGYYAIPVYKDRVDRVVGLINALDLLGAEPNTPIKKHIKDVIYSPEVVSIQKLANQLCADSSKMVIIIDEYGGAKGIVTLSDIIQEVIKEFGHDFYYSNIDTTTLIHKLSKRDYVVRGRADVDTVINELKIVLPKGEYTTIAGMVLHHAHQVLPVGGSVEIEGITFTVLKATSQRLEKVRVKW